jgi:hypothetical protein
MELDELKSAWKNIEIPAKTTEEIQLMLLENKHPVLKKIRMQLTVEIIIWSIFLFCYYTMFDGDKKPVIINIILISGIFLSLVHNLMGYRSTKYLVNGITIKESLESYLSGVKRYAIVSVLSRVLLMIGFILFFTYGIHFNAGKYVSLAVIILIFLIHLLLLYRLWAGRLKSLRISVESLGEDN